MEEQVLVSGDGYYTVLYKRSIVFDPAEPDLHEGMDVSYYYPEDSACKRTYKGTILKISEDVKELIKLKNRMIKEDERKSKVKRRQTSVKVKDAEEESVPNSLLNKIDTALRLNRELTVLLEEIKEQVKSGQEIKTSGNLTKSISEITFQFDPLTQFSRPDLRKETELKNSHSDSLTQPTPSDVDKEIEEVFVDQETNDLSAPSPSQEKVEKEFDSDSQMLSPNGKKSDETTEENSEDSLFIFTEKTAKDEAIELLPNSKVFIAKDRLKEIKDTAQTQTIVARMLLTAVFNEKALLECSLMGKGKQEKKLPSSAVKTILSFCRRYAAKKPNWNIVPDSTVKDSLRYKLKEIKKKIKTIEKKTSD